MLVVARVFGSISATALHAPRALALDLDGTLLTTSGRVSDATVVLRWPMHGVERVGVNSGAPTTAKRVKRPHARVAREERVLGAMGRRKRRSCKPCARAYATLYDRV